MTLIACKDLGVTLGAPLFTDLTFSLTKGDHVGLVAANGRGKSTLLRCLAGTHEPTAGEVTRARGLQVGHVEQDIPEALLSLPLRETVLRALPPEQQDSEGWRVDIVLDDLEVPEELRDRPMGALSGGWQRTALLARAWVTEPDVLLMDEPTNHLDLGRIGFLQTWLSTVARSVPVVVASHDRAFLDAVSTRTLFLREARSQVFALPYTRARAALAEADAADERRFDNDIKQAAQLRRQAAKLKNIGINSGSDLLVVKTKQLKERADRLEEAARPAHQERSAGAIRLANAGTPSKALVAFDDVAVAAPDGRLLFKTGKLWINKGDRIVLLGRNGSGKSQLMALLHRAMLGDVPGVTVAPTVVEGWSDQSLGQLDTFPTPWAAVTAPFDVGDQWARALLAGAGLGVDLQGARIAALSGGQKARLAMLVLRLTRPNLYLLDEPTNHLDIEGQEALEAELGAQGTSGLLVSHDRAFVRGVGTRFWQIQGRRLVEVDGPEGFFREAVGSE
ncbi:ABC-F family ATP-binding cassette domain-containing protein [Rubellimicrobium roseum]|uniref:ABC-F family ATP-binding cassette domain-containing protein n=1 Tax=Rubellimicrobium roseum TaxID=687525 RepID=A0A5C4NB79_9RHOB|nr:ABC-F family ATP-binding cassette domain-containing protein [Rubellimicrobium roseum]TNC62068.1 ABC-F family ATP-binding cassette domain-containing protein [Rubellimicrobium roseum]